jgi:hypothetical protein
MPLPPWLRKPKPPGTHIGGRYTHGNKGRAPEWPDGPWFRSRAERNYARFLTWQGIAWSYEPKSFLFEAVRSGKNRQYRPDFYLPDEDVYHEVKGWMDKDSAIKLKRMKKFYPEVTVIVVPKPFFESIERQRLCRLVPFWECSHHAERLVEVTKTYVNIPPPKPKRRRRT